MSEKLLTLPIGIQSFERLRGQGCLYVDKTERLMALTATAGRCFLSRPRRFGKSLTISTLDAMFSGKAELFEGLAAEAWVKDQAQHPAPVLRLDMSALRAYTSAEELKHAIVEGLRDFAAFHDLELLPEEDAGGMLLRTIQCLFKMGGPVVVLIDEYDKPILDNMGELERADAMRQVLRSFYTVLKGCDEYLRFVMLTGISKFTKTGIFSAMNNLNDISMDKQYGDIVGYTQAELEEDFSGWLENAAAGMKLERGELLKQMKDYYDGFCFDGQTRLYNPFSILNFLSRQEFKNYWYTSGSPSFIVSYMKRHKIQDPAEYRHREVLEDFAEAQEIERAAPESFLYQSGYLTIEEKKGNILVLDYPNYEVRNSLVRMYLDQVYHVREYVTLGGKLWEALSAGDVGGAVQLYNTALSGVPYDDFPHRDESWYRSLFLMLLRGAGISVHGEVHGSRGRTDVLVGFPSRVVVLEFKLAKDAGEVEAKRVEGQKQMEEKGYARPYESGPRELTTAVIVIDGTERQAVL